MEHGLTSTSRSEVSGSQIPIRRSDAFPPRGGNFAYGELVMSHVHARAPDRPPCTDSSPYCTSWACHDLRRHHVQSRAHTYFREVALRGITWVIWSKPVCGVALQVQATRMVSLERALSPIVAVSEVKTR